MKKYLLTMLTVFCFYAYGQQPNFLRFDDTNGLLDFEQYNLLQDQQHYIWIAGNSGIFKYDGNHFLPFQSTKMAGNALTNLRKDGYNRVWCHDFSGNIYYVNNHKLEQFSLWDPKKSSSFPVFEIKGDKLWVIYHEGADCYSIPGNIASATLLKTIYFRNSRSAYLFKNNLYVSALNEVISIDEDYKICRFNITGKHVPDFLNAWSFYFAIGDKLYMLSRHSKSIYVKTKHTFLRIFELPFLPDITNCKVIANYIWILTRNGAYVFDKNFRLQKTYFENIPISDIMMDYGGNYWFSTLTKGVLQVPSLNTLVYNTNESQGFTKLASFNNMLVAGSTNGNIYAITTDSLKPIYQTNLNKEISFLSAYHHELYFGNKDFGKITTAGKSKYVGVNPSFKQFECLNDTLALAADPGGLYYYGISEQELKISRIPRWAQKLCKEEAVNNGQGQKRIFQILLKERTYCFYMAQDFIIASTKSGTQLIDSKGKSVPKYNNQVIYSNGFTGNDSCVYAATGNLGVLVYKNKQWSELSRLNSKLGSLNIQKIRLVNQHLWLASNEGVIRYDLNNGSIQYFTKENGLITYKVNDLYNFGDRMYVATGKGIVALPLDMNANKRPPSVWIDKITCDNQLLCIKENSVNTKANAHVVAIEYDVLEYNTPERYTLRYKLEKTDFINLGVKDYTIILNQLAPGNNPLLVELYDLQQNKIVYSRQINIAVAYAFYQTWYFRLAVLLIILFAVYLAVKKRIHAIQTKNRESLEKEKLLKELNQSMLTSIKAQMNPHFMYNTLNSIQALILKHDIKNSNLYLSKFSHLMRKVLDVSGQEEISVQEETDILELYLTLEKLRFGNDFSYAISISETIDTYNTMMPPLLLQPFVENAIKHGLMHKKGEKNLHISIMQENEVLTCIIRDNGIGRRYSKEIKERQGEKHRSFSTEAIQKRLELLNHMNYRKITLQINDLYEEVQASGTEVVLKIG